MRGSQARRIVWKDDPGMQLVITLIRGQGAGLPDELLLTWAEMSASELTSDQLLSTLLGTFLERW